MIKSSIDFLKTLDRQRQLMMGVIKRVNADMGKDVNRKDYHLIMLLQELGKARLRDIAEFSGPKPIVCLHLGALERKKIVARETDMDDRRNVYYYLTVKGKRLAEEIRARIRDSVDGIFGNLAPEDLKKLSDGLEEINRIFTKVVGADH